MTITTFVRLLFLKLKQKTKIKIKILLNPKKHVYEFWNKNLKTKYFLIIFFCFSFENSRRSNVVLVNIFFNVLKKLITATNGQNGVFWRLIAFFSVFSKMPTKRTFVRLLFLKLNQSRNTKKKIFGGFFFINQKHAFLGVQNSSF